MTSPAEVSHLKEEVAELWRRFKSGPAEPNTADEPHRQALLDETRRLDVRHRELMRRRDELDHARRLTLASTDARRMAFALLGLLLGAGSGAALLVVGLEPLAHGLTELPPIAGALLLLATVPAPLLLRLR